MHEKKYSSRARHKCTGVSNCPPRQRFPLLRGATPGCIRCCGDVECYWKWVDCGCVYGVAGVRGAGLDQAQRLDIQQEQGQKGQTRATDVTHRIARHTLQAMIQALSFHHGSVNGAAADGADGSVHATQQQVTRVVWRGAPPSPCELIFFDCSCYFRQTRPPWLTFDARAFA
jgi:hypothetical protein